MILNRSQFCSLFLMVSIAFYAGFVSFLGRLLSGGASYGDFEAAASGNKLNQLTILVLIVFSSVLFLKDKQLTANVVIKMAWPWLLLVGFFALSSTWSVETSVTLRRLIAFTALVFVCFSLSIVFTAKSLLNFIANTILFAAYLGFAYMLISGKGLSFDLSDRGGALKGIYFDKNGAARIYAYGIILLVGLERYKSKKDLFALFFLSLTLLGCASASGLIMAVFGVALIAAFRIFKGKTKQQTFLRFIALLGCFVVAAYLINLSYGYILELLGRDAQLTNRAIIWELITPYIQDKPLWGYGFGAFWASSAVSGFVERWGFIGNAHSGYYEAMLHGGLVGIGILCVVIFTHASNVFKMYISPAKADVAIIFFALLVVQLVTNYVGYVILNHNSFDMFMLTLCYFIGAKYKVFD